MYYIWRPRLPIRPSDERPPAMYGHFCLVPRVSVHDRYYCTCLTAELRRVPSCVMFDSELKMNLIAAGSPVIINGDEFENIEVHNLTIDAAGSEGNRSNGHDGKEQHSTTPSRTEDYGDATRGPPPVGVGTSDLDRQYSSGYGSESGDMLRELVKNKELLMKSVQRNNLSKCSSIDSDLSDASAMVRSSTL